MSATRTAEAKVTVAEEVYVSLPQRPDRVRECINAAEQAMNQEATTSGRRLAETPRLVDQRSTGLGYYELTFHADTAPA